MKLMIIIGITVFSFIGAWMGAFITHGDYFSGWSILLGIVGSFFGVWAGFKAGQSLGL